MTDDRVILDPGNPADDDTWRPEVSLEHGGDRNELYVVVGEEVGGMIEGVSSESWEAIKRRLAQPSLTVLSLLPEPYRGLLIEAWFEWISEREAATQEVEVASNQITEAFRS